jgi:hypothetical protein
MFSAPQNATSTKDESPGMPPENGDHPYATLGGLGIDIRRMIYEHALQIGEPTTLTTITTPTKIHRNCMQLDFSNVNTALFRLNKQISEESLEYFYQHNQFVHVRTNPSEENRDNLMQVAPVRFCRPQMQTHKFAVLRVSFGALGPGPTHTLEPKQDGVSVILRTLDISRLCQFINFYNYLTPTWLAIQRISLDFNLEMCYSQKRQTQVLKGIIDAVESCPRLRQYTPFTSQGLMLKLEFSGDIEGDQVVRIQESMATTSLRKRKIRSVQKEFMTNGKRLVRSNFRADWIKAYGNFIMVGNTTYKGVNDMLDSAHLWDVPDSALMEAGRIDVELFGNISLVLSRLELHAEATTAVRIALMFARTASPPIQEVDLVRLLLRSTYHLQLKGLWDEAIVMTKSNVIGLPNCVTLFEKVSNKLRKRRLEAESLGSSKRKVLWLVAEE